MLLAGIRKLLHIELEADIFSFWVVLLEFCGTHHHLHPFRTSGLQEMQVAGLNQFLPYNPRWPISKDMQELFNLLISYYSAKRATAHALSQLQGRDRGEVCPPGSLQFRRVRGSTPGARRLRAECYPSCEDGATACAKRITTTIKVSTQHPYPIQIDFYLIWIHMNLHLICLCMGVTSKQPVPMVVEEEQPQIAVSAEPHEVTVEQLDDSSNYPSFTSLRASNSSASNSGASARILRPRALLSQAHPAPSPLPHHRKY